MGRVDLGVISAHSVTENRMDEITQRKDQGWKFGNIYIKRRMEGHGKSEGDREKVIQEVGGDKRSIVSQKKEVVNSVSAKER